MSSVRAPMVRAAWMCLLVAAPAMAEWKVLPPTGERSGLPQSIPGDAQTIRPGDSWPQDNQFRWLIGELKIPAEIDNQSTAGKPVGIRINCGDGGEVFLNGRFQSRYDNDHPALVLVAEKAVPGTPVRIEVQVYGKVQGGDKFDEAAWTILEPKRALQRLSISVNAAKPLEPVPDGIIGLSQGGGLADYEDSTAAKLKEGGFKWFRMDNIFTNVLKKPEGASPSSNEWVWDWTDFDKRTDFIVKKLGAEPIFAVSYMPHALDAVDNPDRQSAPRDYGVWEELCYRAAARAIERGVRVPSWEVWNEVNTGWLKPGPNDTGTPEFRRLYEAALGKTGVDQETVRRFEAYAKLYRATARGVRRADPDAKVGGPALASGPFESSDYGFCANGRGFARGLMAWCVQEKLPLDFVSWHEYFHPADIIAGQADEFRKHLDDYPQVKKTVKSFVLSEWSEAWWPNRPQDHEVGSAYCADCVIRAFIPKKIDRPCFFYVKQNDMGFRGDWSMIMQDNVPKPTFNMAKIFNGLSGRWLPVDGTDDEVCAVAAWDAQTRRLAVVVVNFRYRHNLRRHVRLTIDSLPRELAGGKYVQWTIDGTHSNVWHDRNRAELERTGGGALEGAKFVLDATLEANSVTLVELRGANDE
ncbi:MAG TPA: hypothetical protein PL151_17115 [Phycisphaerae bacterium]|nr:hypothetical protein [Phycisphaerae bacterium]HOJ76000.1 hypothetical protein [Phycisphaerae bacterium]HOM53417.1 hypothetical protein [Phycisphaerae bacterium]HPU28663.1 hypothetical protein [Phycisphaerae bacterium]HQE29482.1 hypothetical protein [Phycisphaerae bacterium]